MTRLFLPIAFLFLSSLFGFDASVLPNPRETGGRSVLDRTSSLAPSEIANLDARIREIERTTGVQIAMVLVPTTDGDVEGAAQSLFTAWGVGKKGADNGLLVLLSLQERKFRTHTGYGLESVLPDVVCKHLQEESAIPELKKGRVYAGLEAYLERLGKLVADPDASRELQVTLEMAKKLEAEQEERRKRDAGDRSLALGGGVLALVLLSSFVASRLAARRRRLVPSSYDEAKALLSKDATKAEGAFLTLAILASLVCLWFGIRSFFLPSSFGWPGDLGALAASIGSVILSFFTAGIVASVQKERIAAWRKAPHPCRECRSPMRKLSESEDDAELKAHARVEEKIGSVDYDVWFCSGCSSHQVEAWAGPHAGAFEVCDKCSSKAFHSVGSRTVRSATLDSEGSEEKRFRCEACRAERTRLVVLPRLSPPSSSDTSSSSSGSSGSSSSSSYGGGSSGGGGSTSSW